MTEREQVNWIRAEAKWTDSTLLGLVLDYVESKCDLAELLTHLQAQADEEADNVCTICGEKNTTLEGFDGMCGDCADRAEDGL